LDESLCHINGMSREDRAFSFDTIAEIYDAVRPDYPAQLYQDMVAFLGLSPTATVLDIGCGTGKSTRLFAGAAHRIVALDPGERLLSRCRANLRDYPEIEYVNSAFEEWDPGPRRFDLVISGTAYHWVEDPDLSLALSVLKPGGALVVFWHTFMAGTAPVFDTLSEIYHELAPELYLEDVSAIQDARDSKRERAFALSPHLSVVRVVRYYFSREYSTTEYLNLLGTYSTHRDLTDRFFEAVETAIREAGGSIRIPIRTTCIMARR
jgi:ubiquinone/menaquinone biosynthesis C-methylase UbiE